MGLKPETTTGGNALKFYASQRYDVRRNLSQKTTDASGEMTGNKTVIKIVKNKIFPPFKEIELDIEFGKGFCKLGNLLDLADKFGIVEKSGAWWSYQNGKIGQGRENAKQFLRENPEILEEIKTKVYTAINSGELPL